MISKSSSGAVPWEDTSLEGIVKIFPSSKVYGALLIGFY